MELDSANSVSYSKQSSISLPGCPGDEFVVEFEEYTCQLCTGSTHKQAGMRWPRDHGEISNKYPAVMIFVFLAPFFSPCPSSTPRWNSPSSDRLSSNPCNHIISIQPGTSFGGSNSLSSTKAVSHLASCFCSRSCWEGEAAREVECPGVWIEFPSV